MYVRRKCPCPGEEHVFVHVFWVEFQGCDEVEKVAFWEEMDRQLSEIPAEERLIIGGDMNGHVGRTTEGIERVHGDWGVGERNDEEERVMDCAVSFYLAIVNTCFDVWSRNMPVKRVQEKKLIMEEMQMLRWMCGVTKMDRIKNERIRGTTKVVELSKKAQERRLQWHGHVMRRDESYVGRRVMQMEVPGRRVRGRPERRWMDVVREDIRDKQLSEDDAFDRAR
ncbi:uncharacterized protein [Macrobrachium rosenbergii]|uniref:uncharacterized protein n=1 Tax=Macrobrachium rosenbergii TaxID=79674 RepID=UPI0034D7B43A